MKTFYYLGNRTILNTILMAVAAIILIGCDMCKYGWCPPPPPCESIACPDLTVQLLGGTQTSVEGGTQTSIKVRIINIGDLATSLPNSVISSSPTIRVIFYDTFWVVNENLWTYVRTPLKPDEIVDPEFFTGTWYSPHVPNKVEIYLNVFQDEKDIFNNKLTCYWLGEAWGNCFSPAAPTTAVTQADTGESTASGFTASPFQLVESKKESFLAASSNFAPNALEPFAGKFFGFLHGIDDTSAPFLMQFVDGDSAMVGLQILPGLKISMCDSSGPVHSFFDAAAVTITGNSFTTGPLETNNKAKVTLSGNLSEDGKILDLAMKIDPNQANCGKTLTAIAEKFITPMNLTLQLQESPSEVIAGQSLAYKLNVTNNGRVSSLNPVLYATVPASLNLITPAGVYCVPQSDTQVCQIPIAQLDPNTSTVLDLVFDTTQVATKSFVSRFETIADGDPSLDIAPEDNVAEAAHHVTFVADVSITKSASPNPVAAGSVLRYIITVKNNGPSLAEAVSVQDTLPQGVTLVSSSATANCVLSDMTLTCTLGALTAGASAEIIVEVLVDADLVYKAGSPTTITNQASVTGAADAIDPDLSNNATSLDTLVIAVADLEISTFEVIDAPKEILVDEDIELTLSKFLISKGPSNPMRTRLINRVSTSGGITSTATNRDLQNMASDLSEEPEILGEVLDVYTIRCVAPGKQTFTFTSEIQPLHPEDTDPDLSNNVKTLHLDVECMLPVAIDIRTRTINLSRPRPITVFVLTNSAGEFDLPLAFDASTIDPLSVRFGLYDTVWNETGGASDTDGNGQRTRRWMRLHFGALESGLTEDATTACVKGIWIDTDGIPRSFFGCDTVVVQD
jgi:uncharacterized repeat protein (TIGR01451 family)